MTTHARATFQVSSWDEKPYLEMGDGGKLTRATVTQTFEGDIEGEGTVEYLMAYSGDGGASFVGQQHVVGRVGGRSGSFVLQHTGTSHKGVVADTWFVVPRSGTGELRGLRGEGGFTSGPQARYPVTLDYGFE